MRRSLVLTLAVLALPMLSATPTQAQSQQERQIEQHLLRQERNRPGRVTGRANAGPCPFVKVLYDAARYVEFQGDQVTAGSVGYTGEIEDLSADCSYREGNPIVVDMDILFHLGRGPQAQANQRSYRYWIAVTERNSAILTKEYFDLPVNFEGSDRTAVIEEIRGLTIPRANAEVSGANFEILIGFDVTPQMAEFNRSGSRFRINAGQ